jgi:hypothetical protein
MRSTIMMMCSAWRATPRSATKYSPKVSGDGEPEKIFSNHEFTGELSNVTTKKMTGKLTGQMTGKTTGVLISSLALAAILAGCGGNKTSGGSSSGSSSSGSGGSTVATVNGEGIAREELRDYLEASQGESALSKLIEYSLVMQEAKKEGITVSDADVQASIDARRGQDPNVALIEKAGGVRLDALKRQVRYQLALDGLLTKDVKVNEADLKKWFDTHAKYYNQPERVKFGFLLSTTKARADTMAAQLKGKTKTFQELVDEQKKSNDQLGRGSQAEAPAPTPTSSLPPAIKTGTANLKPGENSGVLALGQAPRQAFAIVRLIERTPAVKADLTKMKSQIEADYKLEQVARKLNGQNPQNPNFEKTVQQITGYMAQQGGGATPSYRAILDFINQTAVANLTSKLQTGAKVEIQDAAYERVGEQYKAMAAAAPSAGAPGAAAPAGAAK